MGLENDILEEEANEREIRRIRQAQLRRSITAHNVVRGAIVICKLCRRAKPELENPCVPLPPHKQMTAAEIEWVESSLLMPGIPTQPAPDTSGEWRVQAMPTHGWRVVDATEQEIVADVYREEDARQIVSDHNAVPKLVAALKDALFEAEVSTVLWHQSRGFVGTVEDAYDKGLMPPAFVRARAALAAVGREEER
jgi:hypothetical protein